MLELVTREIRRPIKGLEYNSLRNENLGKNRRGLEVTLLQPPVPFSTSLSILQYSLILPKIFFIISFYDSNIFGVLGNILCNSKKKFH